MIAVFKNSVMVVLHKQACRGSLYSSEPRAWYNKHKKYDEIHTIFKSVLNLTYKHKEAEWSYVFFQIIEVFFIFFYFFASFSVMSVKCINLLVGIDLFRDVLVFTG